MDQIHSLNHSKLNECFAQLQRMDMVTKSKMFKFYRNVSKMWLEMDKEFVNCRRLKSITAKYTTLEQQYNEGIKIFEQWSLIAVLTY